MLNCVSGQFWNRNLLYVAGSHHKKSMHLYIDETSYASMKTFMRDMVKNHLKGNVLDYPFNFAKRRGLETEILYERIKKYLVEKIAVVKNQLDQNRKHRIQNHSKTFQQKDYDEVEMITTKLEKLLTDFEQAKKEDKHYQVYKFKRILQQEIQQISKNKQLYQEIKIKNAYLGKRLDSILETEYEI